MRNLTTASVGPSLLLPEQENHEIFCQIVRKLGAPLVQVKSILQMGILDSPRLAISSELVCRARFWILTHSYCRSKNSVCLPPAFSSGTGETRWGPIKIWNNTNLTLEDSISMCLSIPL